MIHIDLEKEEMEYNCSGEQMIEEMAAVLATSMYGEDVDGVYEDMPEKLEDHVDGIFEMAGKAIGELAKAMYWALKENKVGEEENDEEERSDEEIRTVIKQYRRGRAKRTTS